MDALQVLSRNYLIGQHTQPTDSELNALKQWVVNSYLRLPVKVQFMNESVSPEVMLDRYTLTNTLWVSTENNDSPILGEIENLMFRAVHDFHHVKEGFSFDLIGEINAARFAISTAPKCIHWILWSEIALQAAAQISTGKFQEQKVVHCYF